MDLQLDTRLELKSAEADGRWGKFSGIATTSDEDLAGDVIAARAFEPIDVPNVALLAFHDPSAPVGKWTSLTQQGRRLIAKGALLLSLPKAREVYDMLKGGVLNGLSVGFRPDPAAVTIDARGKRTISKAALLEISLVSVPANAHCRVTETLAYHPDTLEQRLARLDASGSRTSPRRAAAFSTCKRGWSMGSPPLRPPASLPRRRRWRCCGNSATGCGGDSQPPDLLRRFDADALRLWAIQQGE